MTLPDQRSPSAPRETVPLELCAGPLALLYENGMVRDIRFGGREIVRRIYAAVRDEHWNTVPGELSDFSIEKTSSAFSLGFSSRHRKGDIDFLWNGRISGIASGEINFSFSGIALSQFRRNRIGLCVLHPVDAFKGMPCRIETADGATVDAQFPYDIAAHQPFVNLRAMSYAVASGLNATVRFTGDIFETEDGRNWTDATYKTYSTPLSAPLPQTMEKGSMIRQQVSVHLDKPAAPLPFRPSALQIAFDAGGPSGVLPGIGVLDAGGAPAPAALALLRRAGLSHVRTDLYFSRGGAAQQLERARLLHEQTGMPAELALHFTAAASAEAGELGSLLREKPLAVRRFLVYSEQEPSVSAEIVGIVTKALQGIAPLAGGTNGYFVEINRRRPPAELLEAVCYSATPQVHTIDDVAVMENLAGLLETLDSAHRFSGSKAVVVSPLTLRPRKLPERPHKDGGPDPRQETLFAAAWALGCLAYCVEGGAESITVGETAGPGGCMAVNGESVFPLYVLFSWVSAFIKRGARRCGASDPRSAIGLSFATDGPFTAIVANLTASRLLVQASGLPADVRCSILDEPSFVAVRALPDPAARLSLEPLSVKAGRCSLELPPYALAKLQEPQAP